MMMMINCNGKEDDDVDNVDGEDINDENHNNL